MGRRRGGQQVSFELDQQGRGLLVADPRTRPELEAYEFQLTPSGAELNLLGSSKYGFIPVGNDFDGTGDRYLILDQYMETDTTLWLWERSTGRRRLLRGVPVQQREPGRQVDTCRYGRAWFVDGDSVLVETTAFDDLGGLAVFSLDSPQDMAPVRISGVTHTGQGEFTGARRLDGDRFLLQYNVDGVSWGYEARLDAAAMVVSRALWGTGELAGGVVEHAGYDIDSDRFAVSFSTAAMPAQLAVIGAADDGRPVSFVTRNRIVGVDAQLLSPGQDASYVSHDGLRVSARLYLPAGELGFTGPRPIVYYIHGGPQGQERPDFTWFSMPLIQYLTLRGFAVFVPNVRGSSGYGQDYVRRVDRDWGGQDRLDHVAAVEHLRQDPRVDATRIGVMGRSYGGFMTLTLAGRHPQLWSAAIDMFGPYDLPKWLTRLPESWQTYFHLAIGHPERDLDELIARSPRTYLDKLACPMMVIQGANDPRVTKADSDEVVQDLRAKGKQIEYLVFDDEGHDITKTVNKVRCYNAIADFMAAHLRP